MNNHASPVAAVAPFISWEIGTSLQPNGGKGIDEGTYWRLDLTVQPDGSIPGASITSDGFVQVPPGFYLVSFDGHLITTAATGQYQTAALSTMAYGFPGVYQLSLINYQQLTGDPSSLTLSASRLFNCHSYDDTLSFGYDKGSDGSAVLQGFFSVIQLSA
ncbi:hypothetical protein [Paraburkholderia sp. J12]|uniref:hypothetical protein n=1 Tax=Paraburkholderia sp. J12 TaxID=2805432 RepID=UPI002ABDC494|nr:hypothetical protein [Paraburkholderia sp. J12]